MRRSRARLLAAAVVVSTAGAASAALDLVVGGDPSPHGAPIVVQSTQFSVQPGAAGADGGMTIDDGLLVGSDGPTGGFDAPMEGGFDAPTEGGFDAPSAGSDGGMIPDAMLPATIGIVEPTIAITGPQGVLSQADATVVTADTGQLGSAAIFSADSSMKLSYCGLTTCNWSPPQVLPYSLTVECVPGPMQTVATLMVFEATNGSSGMASVTCTSTSSNPILNVTPDALDFTNVPVGQTPSQMIYVENTGFGTLSNVVINFGGTTNANQWSASACTAASPCSFGAGSGMFVSITFAPTTHGPKNVLATVTSANGGSDTVSLLGTGTGGVMSVQTPPGPQYLLDIGTIPKGQAFARDIVLANSGNAVYTATTTTPTAPYTIAAGPHQVAAGGTANIAVTCMSATASSDDNPQTITINSDAYLGSPATVDVRCKIADTTLQIMPTMFDFGEVRIGSSPPPIPITLTNPPSSAGSAMITAFDLRLHKNGLSLTKPNPPFTIAPGTNASASLSLATTEDTDLTGEYIDITVDGTTLSFPVTGKVVHPHAYVTPPNLLDLGTACVGTQISGDVVMTNDGTATLFVMPPVMTPSFVAAAPATPGPLPPGMTRTATVTPAMSAMGPIEGMLSWTEDTPMTHEVGVKLDYVATGTALSPRGLDFGIVEVDGDELTQHLTLQNCDQTPTSIKIESLKTKAGTLGAWHLVPMVGYTKQLGARETQAVQVSFDPPARGKYEADITVQTSSGKQVVHLVGEATGRDFDNTSFYACACNGRGAPSRGWPIVLAVVAVIFRRPPRHKARRPL